MRLLVIGTMNNQLMEASAIAKRRGATVSHCSTVESAMQTLRGGKGADLIMAEVSLNIELLVTQLETERMFIPVIACGIDGDTKHAVAAIKAGAKEYIPLPPDEEMIAAVLAAVTEESTAFIANNKEMKLVTQMALQVAPSEASILITGDSGTGKEVVARFIHQKSKRTTKPMISVNCAAIPENLLESELFGHEKGAFTGAVARRIGKFEEADGGTLLLDEISEMDLKLQAKLLRAIQEREIDRVGGSSPVKINIRILATSNRDLHEEVKAGKFRQDLFYRLNVIHIQLPPLRKRGEDILSLATFFNEKYTKLNGVDARAFSKQALSKLQNYKWPGNVRELENIVHRAVLLASGKEIGEEAIILNDNNDSEHGTAHNAGNGALVGKTIESMEKELIINTLDHCLGNRTHAANILGISIRTLRNKLNIYNAETS